MDSVAPILGQYLVQTPVFLAWFGGVVLGLVYWRRHPKVSLLTVIALILFFVRSLVGTFLNAWLPITLRDGGIGIGRVGTLRSAYGVISALVGALAWGFDHRGDLRLAAGAWSGIRRGRSSLRAHLPSLILPCSG